MFNPNTRVCVINVTKSYLLTAKPRALHRAKYLLFNS